MLNELCVGERLVVTGVARPIPGRPHDDNRPLVLLTDYPDGRYYLADRHRRL